MNTRRNNSIYKISQRIGLMALPGLVALSIAPVQAQNMQSKPIVSNCTTPTTTVRADHNDYVYVMRRSAVYQLRSSDLSLVSRKPLTKSGVPVEACFVSQDGSPVASPTENSPQIDPRSTKNTANPSHKVSLDTSIDAEKYGGSANTPADNPGTAENNFSNGTSTPLRGEGRMAGMVDGNIPLLTWSTASRSHRRSEPAQSDTASYIYMLRGNKLYQYRAKGMSLVAQRDLALLDLDRALHGGSDIDTRPVDRGLAVR